MDYPEGNENTEFHQWLQENVNNRKVAYHRAKEVYKDQPLVLTDVFGSWTEAQYIHDMFHAYLGKVEVIEPKKSRSAVGRMGSSGYIAVIPKGEQ